MGCGMGVLPLKKMLPLTLGANIGTTCTALIAACVDLKFNGVQIALAHLLFNILGILVWFPVPYTRRIPLPCGTWYCSASPDSWCPGIVLVLVVEGSPIC